MKLKTENKTDYFLRLRSSDRPLGFVDWERDTKYSKWQCKDLDLQAKTIQECKILTAYHYGWMDGSKDVNAN